MNVLQHTRNERNPCLKQNRPDRSYRDTLLKFKSEKKNTAQANLSQNDLLQIGEKGTNFKCTLSLAEIR